MAENVLTAHDADLDAEITDAEHRLREAAAIPYEPGKAAETLSKMSQAAEKLRPVKAERRRRRQSREQARLQSGLKTNRQIREAAEEAARKRAELKDQHAAALDALYLLWDRLPKGPRYVAERLTRDEGETLLGIARRLEDGKNLTKKEQARYDTLVDKAAGDPGLCQRVRDDATSERRAKAAAEEERLGRLKQRPAAAPGSLVLPGCLSDWLGSRKEGSLDQHKLGVLSALALGFENHRPTLVGAHIEIDTDGEAVQVDPTEPLRLISDPGDGSRATAEAVAYLSRNELITFERNGTSVRVSAGPRLRKLYDNGRG